jgi:HSP90 family molecular chaperone
MDDFCPMSVAKMGFLVDQLNRDCSPLQFLRELTKNGVEAIQRLHPPVGEIRWDVDWNRFDLMGADRAPQKLCVIDTGAGMTGEEMVHYINKLSSSINEQSATGNFGVGAKIAADLSIPRA